MFINKKYKNILAECANLIIICTVFGCDIYKNIII